MIQFPTVTLNNGVVMPQLGLGVWQTKDGEEVIDAVHGALQAGYRLIDTAAVYANEQGVGDAIITSDVRREDVFVTTKLWNSDQGYATTLKAFEKSLKALKLDYVDLYLIHWPAPALDRYIDTWRAFEEIHASGRAKAIGVCNFTQEHLDRLLDHAEIVPAVNQIELHPRFQQADLRAYCASKGIQVESWSPLGGSGGDLLDEPLLSEIATKYRKSPAQVVLRWHLQLGLAVIPKSIHPERIRQNSNVFDFELDADDMRLIAQLNKNERRGPDPATMNRDISTGVVQFASRLGLVRFPRRKR